MSVNTLGAITTNRNPPQIEVLGLEKITGIEEKYTYERNWDYLMAGRSKSYVYETYFESFMAVPIYYWMIVSIILATGYGLFAWLKLKNI